jgi:hypothetical protein
MEEKTFYAKVQKKDTQLYDVEILAPSLFEARRKALSSMDLLLRDKDRVSLTHNDISYSFLGFRTEHHILTKGKDSFPLGGVMLSENYAMDEEGDVWVRLPEKKD